MIRKKQLPPWLALLFLLLLCLLLVIATLTKPSQQRGHVEKMVEKSIPPVAPEVAKPGDQHETQPDALPRVASGLALVLDDVGYDLPALKRILALSIPVAIAVIPDAPYAQASATMAHEQGQMVMLHLPMEPTSEKYRNKMTPYFLHEKMGREELRETFQRGLDKVPFVEGVNNHMGSHLSEQMEPMRWVMQVCREQGFFFVDSKTSHKSVAAEAAELMDVPWASREVFLDHDLNPEAMQRAWKSAERCLEKGYRCVVIAHPHKETVAFLEKQLSKQKSATLVPVQQLLRGGDSVRHAKIKPEVLL
ncbi:hypothetical protein Ga0123461_2408 [Mariprofundus aestuarium]|uniref:Divergent polysaccharide deacetylase n=1 Tax=Mariprofundus aestuarium TaxID=1921086 RepID=A0A2K8L0K5_MARES|nr:divergent polysaccharide deacetylase family protein [Mariprofundus aestuarium]ATX80807.1 hypothetical protein Ga0123461_2408 [Mariprofundus aestuarium]